MADAVIMDDNGGVHAPAGKMRIRATLADSPITMDELKDPEGLEHTLSGVTIQNVTVLVNTTKVVDAAPATNVRVIGRERTHVPHDVVFSVENSGRNVLVSSIQALINPTSIRYDTGKKAMITNVEVNGTSIPIDDTPVVVTVTYG